MRLVLLFLMAVVAHCAPAEEIMDPTNTDADDLRVKLTKEQMMSGNRQIESKDKKKITRPIIYEEVDKEGLPFAKLSVNSNITESQDGDKKASYQGDKEDKKSYDKSNDAEATLLSKAGESVSESDVDIMEPRGTEVVEQLKTYNKIKGERDVLGYFKDLEDEIYLSQYLDMLQAPYDDKLFGSDYNRYNFQAYRFRGSDGRTNRINSANMRILKRARRIKRALIYPGQPFYTYVDSSVSNNDYPMADEAEYHFDTIDNARKDRTEYDFASSEDVADLYFKSKPQYYPRKRQAGLNFVPGIKRSRDFYPYFKEPEAHFSAFVPQKRTDQEYNAAYKLLMKLAAALRREIPLYEEFEVKK